MSSLVRNWIKEIVRQVIREEIKNEPMIISSRAPNSQDLYEKGTKWVNGKDIYMAREVTVKWQKIQ